MPQKLTLHGLKSCDTCRKALRALRQADVDVEFVDLRQFPPDSDLIGALLDQIGDTAVNRKSTTWRSLDEEQRVLPAEELLAQYPALIKRPVIRRVDGTLSVGWNAEIAAGLGA